VCHPKLEVPVGDVLRRRRLRVIGKYVVALDAPIDGGEGYVVAVERCTSFVIHRAVCPKVRLRRAFSTFEAFDSAFDDFDRSTNPFLDKIRGEVGFVAELVVEAGFGFGF